MMEVSGIQEFCQFALLLLLLFLELSLLFMFLRMTHESQSTLHKQISHFYDNVFRIFFDILYTELDITPSNGFLVLA